MPFEMNILKERHVCVITKVINFLQIIQCKSSAYKSIKYKF